MPLTLRINGTSREVQSPPETPLLWVIRDELGCADTRIILRTGQPGYAPELEVIRDYDINDYKTKSELTRTRLITSLTTAIRSYEQIRLVLESERGMDRIVRSAPVLLAQPTYKWGEVSVKTIADKVLLKKDVPVINRMELVRVTKDNLGTWARQLKEWGFTDVPPEFLSLKN